MFWYMTLNVTLMYVIMTVLNHQIEGASQQDYFIYIAITVTSIVEMTIFLFFNKQNVLANVTKNI